MNREDMQTRSISGAFKTRSEDGGELYIEGYFSVFDSNYDLWPGASESVARGAFSETLDEDIRALVDHETRLVLGRTTANTLELREDNHGLWGRIKINQDARVQRGDITQCSFGFSILDEETENREDGSVHWTIRKVKLYEVSVCTFPAYEDTAVVARKRDYEDIQKRKIDAWRNTLLKRLNQHQQNETGGK